MEWESGLRAMDQEPCWQNVTRGSALLSYRLENLLHWEIPENGPLLARVVLLYLEPRNPLCLPGLKFPFSTQRHQVAESHQQGGSYHPRKGSLPPEVGDPAQKALFITIPESRGSLPSSRGTSVVKFLPLPVAAPGGTTGASAAPDAPSRSK